MPRQRIERDPIGAYQRQAIASRRIGMNAKCACGENRPQALIAGSGPAICIECKRIQKGRTTMDRHHVAGKRNSPVTIPIPANDHKAQLSEAQYDWPKDTLENPDGSPLRIAAACIRGFIDLILFLIENTMNWVADLLELLDDYLRERFGPKWWIGTPVEQVVPKGWRNDQQE